MVLKRNFLFVVTLIALVGRSRASPVPDEYPPTIPPSEQIVTAASVLDLTEAPQMLCENPKREKLRVRIKIVYPEDEKPEDSSEEDPAINQTPEPPIDIKLPDVIIPEEPLPMPNNPKKLINEVVDDIKQKERENKQLKELINEILKSMHEPSDLDPYEQKRLQDERKKQLQQLVDAIKQKQKEQQELEKILEDLLRQQPEEPQQRPQQPDIINPDEPLPPNPEPTPEDLVKEVEDGIKQKERENKQLKALIDQILKSMRQPPETEQDPFVQKMIQDQKKKQLQQLIDAIKQKQKEQQELEKLLQDLLRQQENPEEPIPEPKTNNLLQQIADAIAQNMRDIKQLKDLLDKILESMQQPSELDPHEQKKLDKHRQKELRKLIEDIDRKEKEQKELEKLFDDVARRQGEQPQPGETANDPFNQNLPNPEPEIDPLEIIKQEETPTEPPNPEIKPNPQDPQDMIKKLIGDKYILKLIKKPGDSDDKGEVVSEVKLNSNDPDELAKTIENILKGRDREQDSKVEDQIEERIGKDIIEENDESLEPIDTVLSPNLRGDTDRTFQIGGEVGLDAGIEAGLNGGVNAGYNGQYEEPQQEESQGGGILSTIAAIVQGITGLPVKGIVDFFFGNSGIIGGIISTIGGLFG